MFKFLVYLFLFYIVSKFIFGTLLNFKQNSSANHINNEPIVEDENVKIKSTVSSKSKKTTNSDIGEYVDFEEIK
jgi:hypothetical protein